MHHRLVLLIAAVVLVGPGWVRAEDAQREEAAVAAAQSWLTLIDKGQYGESWKKAAAYFRNAVTEKQWQQSLRAVRKPLGKLVSRKVKNRTFTTTLPGAPDGEYVIIQFETSFANKEKAVETVTPLKDKDGTWRVSGYYIK